MSAITKDFQGITAYDVVAWHRPVASAVCFAAFLVPWFVFVLFEYTLVTFCTRFVQLGFIFGAVLHFTRYFNFTDVEVADRLDAAYESARPYIKRMMEYAFYLLTWRSINCSAKAFIGTFIVAQLGNWIRDSTLFLIAIVALFTLPLVYETKKVEIDAQLAKLQALSDKYLNMARSEGSKMKEKMGKKHADAESIADGIEKKAE